MKHRIGKIGALFAVLGSVLFCTACTNNNDSNASAGTISREQYIGIVGEEFGYSSTIVENALFADVNSSNSYYDAIQACAASGVIDTDKNFDPNGDTTLGFAIETAVKAIGVDELEHSDTGFDSNNLVGYYTSNIAQIDVSDLNKSIDAATAAQIVAYAEDYYMHMELPQYMDCQLGQNTLNGSGITFKGDGYTGVFYGVNDYAVGNVIYIPSTETECAKAVKIESINGLEFTYSEVTDPTQIFDSLEMYGTFDGVVVSATDTYSALDVVYANDINAPDTEYIYDEEGVLSCAVTKKATLNPHEISYTVKFDEVDKYGDPYLVELYCGIKNIKVTTDIDIKTGILDIPYGINRAKMRVDFDTEISGYMEGHVSRTIPLGEVEVSVAGMPISVKLALELKLGADGTFEVKYTNKTNFNVNYNGSALSQSFEVTDSSLTMKSEVTLTAEVSLIGSLRVCCIDICNAEVTTGLVAIVKSEMDFIDLSVPACVDIYAYVPLRWGVNQRGCLMSLISKKLTAKGVVWDSVNNEFNWHWHFEDGGEVAECTRGGENEAVEAEIVDENGNPFEEYKHFEFEVLEFEFIKLTSYSMYMDPGESIAITYESIPSDLSESDLVYSTEDSSVCTVSSNGVVTGVGAGSTVVNIKSKDGVYEIAISVTVADDYSIEVDEL